MNILFKLVLWTLLLFCGNAATAEEVSMAKILEERFFPGKIIYAGTIEEYWSLPVEERYKILLGRKVSYEEDKYPRGPGIVSVRCEIRAKRYLAYSLCRAYCKKHVTRDELRSNAEKASALFADLLSEKEWGEQQLKRAEQRLQALNLDKDVFTKRLKAIRSFYEARLFLVERSFSNTGPNDMGEFHQLLIEAYSDDWDAAVALYEKSLIPQRTHKGKMSDEYKKGFSRWRSEEQCIYNAICEAEARREKQNGSNPL